MTDMLSSKKKPTGNSTFSEFMRNGTDEEHQRVFEKVIDESIKDQQKIIEEAGRIRAERARRSSLEND